MNKESSGHFELDIRGVPRHIKAALNQIYQEALAVAESQGESEKQALDRIARDAYSYRVQSEVNRSSGILPDHIDLCPGKSGAERSAWFWTNYDPLRIISGQVDQTCPMPPESYLELIHQYHQAGAIDLETGRVKAGTRQEQINRLLAETKDLCAEIDPDIADQGRKSPESGFSPPI